MATIRAKSTISFEFNSDGPAVTDEVALDAARSYVSIGFEGAVVIESIELDAAHTVLDKEL